MRKEECNNSHGAVKFVTVLGWLVIIIGIWEIVKRSE